MQTYTISAIPFMLIGLAVFVLGVSVGLSIANNRKPAPKVQAKAKKKSR
ncbi:MAG TPA: hypothetical protein VLG47_02575 [Candidatus Saccharimonadales bacterium]|nr:hypothetical protein [Candidatus Saccharimonadales bacterium]